jgi:hypothetical protein
VKEPFHDSHNLKAIHERVSADDATLPELPDETPRPTSESIEKVHAPHPVVAHNGAELLKELGYQEQADGTIVWT